MEFIQRKPHYPGALSDTAANLLRTIHNAGIWFPEWREMTPIQITAFAELQRAAYVEATAFFGYRVRGRDNMAVIRQYQAQRNEAAVIRESLVSVGIEPSNIKNIHRSPNGFAARPNRWCITLYKSAKVSAVQINARHGLSGAVVNGNIVYVLLGDEIGKVM